MNETSMPIEIGTYIEVFRMEEDEVHIISTGPVVAKFISGWDAKVRYVIESLHANDMRYRVVLRNDIRIPANSGSA